MATSVPAPIAMPTSARASAGASLTPSPTIATRSPRAWSSGDLRVLVLRAYVGEPRRYEALGNGIRHRPGVAIDHDDVDAAVVQLPHGLGDPVGSRPDAPALPRPRRPADVQHVAPRSDHLWRRLDVVREVDAVLAQQCRTTDGDAIAVDARLHTPPGQ